ncbi:hypothetical protein FRC07_003109 [Ceratobasidium sp. 392]|nr:hypothetical protein FRC07_003109 [Ceratobasidium sp. 392]
MSETDTGRPKHLITKTKAIETHEQNVEKSKSNRESRQRTKNIHKEEAALVAAETQSVESPQKSKPKKKKSKSKKAADDEPSARATANEDSDRATDGGAACQAAAAEDEILEGGRQGATKAPPAAKTPAPKRITAIVVPSTIKALGSPINALASAKKQSARLANTLIAATRKRASSTNRDGRQSKRPRKEVLDNIKNSKPCNTNNRSVSGPASYGSKSHTASSSYMDRLQPMLRSPSRAPSASPTPSQHPVAVPTSGPALQDSDSEMLGPSDFDEPMQAPEDEKPTKKKRAAPGQAKDRPRRSDYHGVELKLLDETLDLVCVWLGYDEACPTGGNFERLIRICWGEAARNLGTTVKKWPIDQDHTTDRVGSYRGHAKRNIRGPASAAFGLDGLEGEELTKLVKYLVKKKFYMGAKVEGRSGIYEHPLVSTALRQLFFVGRKSPATKYPGKYNPVPPNALAIALAILQFMIEEYGSGEFKEQELKFKTLHKLWTIHMKNIKFWMGSVKEEDHMKVCTLLYERALKNLGKATFVHNDEDDKNLITLSDLEDNSDDEEDEFAHLLLPVAIPKSSKPDKSSKPIPSPSKSSKPTPSSSKPSKPGKSSKLGKSTFASGKPDNTLGESVSSHKPKPKPKPKPKSDLSVIVELPSSSPPKLPPSKLSSLKPPPPSSKPTSPAVPSCKPNAAPQAGSSSSSDSSSDSSSSSSSDSSSESESSNAESSGAKSKVGSSAAATKQVASPTRKDPQPSPTGKVAKAGPSGDLEPNGSAGTPKSLGDSSELSSDSENHVDTGTGEGPKRGEEAMDVDTCRDPVRSLLD